MEGYIFNYALQAWDEIDTATDRQITPGIFVTACGTVYETNDAGDKYRAV